MKTHLSHSENGWCLIHQGSPLCDYKQHRVEVEAVAKMFGLKLPDVTYCSGVWVPTDTIKDN